MICVLGCSAAHQELLRLTAAASATDAEVLIEGPSGVGKELYARLIHERSARKARAFVAVNCGAIPSDLFENELFGHATGAFTGAAGRTAGLVAEAEQGTLLLDEVDALHPASQVKLLRLIQQKEYRPLGDVRLHRMGARIMAASNVDLLGEVRAGRFRFDLFFRLRVLPLRVPPLRDRRADVLFLLDHFLGLYAAEYGRPPASLTPAALQRLEEYDWPGNVRELENCARYLVCTHGGSRVDVGQLPLLEEAGDCVRARTCEPFNQAKRRVVMEFERGYLRDSLLAHDGNIAAAARASGKHRRAFFELMRRHGLTRSR